MKNFSPQFQNYFLMFKNIRVDFNNFFQLYKHFLQYIQDFKSSTNFHKTLV